MAEALADVASIAKVSIEGIDVIFKMSGSTLKMVGKIAQFFRGMLVREKQIGKTSMRKLLEKGGDLQVLTIEKDELKKLKKQLKKYGVLYSELPDIRKNGNVELIFHSESLPRVNRILEKTSKDKEKAKIKTFDEYVQESDGENLDLLQKEFEKEKKLAESASDLTDSERKTWDSLFDKVAMYAFEKKEANESVSLEEMKKDLSLDHDQAKDCLDRLLKFGVLTQNETGDLFETKMTKEDYKRKLEMFRTFAEKASEMEKANRENVKPIFVAQSLIKEEKDDRVMTRIPGTFGAEERRIAFLKEDIYPRKDEKSFCIYIDDRKEYDIFDSSGKKVDTVSGKKLRENYSSLNQNMQRTLNEERKKKRKPKKQKEGVIPEGNEIIPDIGKKLTDDSSGRKGR